MRVFRVVFRRTVEIVLIVLTLMIAAVLVWKPTRYFLPKKLVQQIQRKTSPASSFADFSQGYI